MSRDLRYAGLLCVTIPALALGQAPSPASSPAPSADRGGRRTPGAEEPTAPGGRTLEERVADLKERISRTKARLGDLQDTVIGGGAASGGRAVLVHRNEMGSSFYLESASYELDGAPIYTKADVDGDLERREELEIFNGRIVPGSHQLAVTLVYRGRGYGLFSYLDAYRFKVRSSYTFDAEPGTVSTVKVVGFERGGFTAELHDRPAIRYDLDVQREDVRPGTVPAAAEGAGR